MIYNVTSKAKYLHLIEGLDLTGHHQDKNPDQKMRHFNEFIFIYMRNICHKVSKLSRIGNQLLHRIYIFLYTIYIIAL